MRLFGSLVTRWHYKLSLKALVIFSLYWHGGMFAFKLCQVPLWWSFKLCVRWTKEFIWLSGTLKGRLIDPLNQAFANIYPDLPFGGKNVQRVILTGSTWKLELSLSASREKGNSRLYTNDCSETLNTWNFEVGMVPVYEDQTYCWTWKAPPHTHTLCRGKGMAVGFIVCVLRRLVLILWH